VKLGHRHCFLQNCSPITVSIEGSGVNQLNSTPDKRIFFLARPSGAFGKDLELLDPSYDGGDGGHGGGGGNVSAWGGVLCMPAFSVHVFLKTGFGSISFGGLLCLLIAVSFGMELLVEKRFDCTPMWFGCQVVASVILAVAHRLYRFIESAGAHRLNRIAEAETVLADAIWKGCGKAKADARRSLLNLGWTSSQFEAKVGDLECSQSENAGVSVAYLLSSDFRQLAQDRTGKTDPTFLDMKDPFWFLEDPIGADIICPRDKKPGCALVDTLTCENRKACTHFLSWVWRYKLSVVQSALGLWVKQEGLVPTDTFLFVCFFVNNQFRILDGSSQGCNFLGDLFERNLRRIGKVVALLDDWNSPVYLKRVWTIFEQYAAVKLGLPVTIILPETSVESLLRVIGQGETGIGRLKNSLCQVNAESAEASVKEDEKRIKALIVNSIGFRKVNAQVQHSMITWISSMVQMHLTQLIDQGPTQNRKPSVAVRTFTLRQVALEVLRSSPAVPEQVGRRFVRSNARTLELAEVEMACLPP